MTLQQGCFSWRGRLGRRDFWIWQAVWLLTTTLLFVLAANDWIETQMAAFGVVCLLCPATAVMVKRLHDRNRRGYWGFVVILAWLLGRAIPFVLMAGLLLDLGVFRGTPGANRFGTATQPVRYRQTAHQ
ncbi:DUF805 domain-containing protein [Pantoea vagans]|uniref:DUF805 domain-containing protein n=1 Tax=Pantoea vagans TaxID=470934 RepID=UPI00076B790C|nr:DUF805 domain-containing protein [Pantoea vagans]AMG56843.1 DUF805 domain-containing protein [Pantoea vagans]